ncbi:hypothetical protein Sm713_06020 [Streptomyces sp. TS71-3]|nr:hypothetical protein Sm713_06020 [Streptomyces sp. TS71-3]
MAGLTAVAVAMVGYLAYQASASAPDSLGAPGPGASASPSTPASPPPHKAPALPAGSGSGERVVYSLGTDRVWLVTAGNQVQRTFTVTPSTVHPAPGTFAVTSRSAVTAGSDGVSIEHVVRFTSVDGVTIGFSAAVDGSTPKPDPGKKTGGIRESRADGAALWGFAGVGEKVVVVR